MSLFSGDHEGDIKGAIKFFNSLPSERRAYIVSNLLDIEDSEVKRLSPLLVSVRNALSSHSSDSISSRLSELGVEETYAVLFVKSMIKDAPTQEYELKEIGKMDDDDFEAKFPRLIKMIWSERVPPQELTAAEGITENQLWAIVHQSSYFMNGLAGSDIPPSRIAKVCKDVGLSDRKVDVMLKTFDDSLDLWREQRTFSDTQDILEAITEMRKQNKLILNSIQEILKVLQKGSGSGNASHFQ